MRIRRRKFHATVTVQPWGDAPIIIGLGVISLEGSLEEARRLALDLADAIETAQRGGGDDGGPSGAEVTR